MLLFLLLAVDLSTGFVGAYFEYETPDIAVYINYFGISTMAGMGKVKTTNFMSSAFDGGVLGVFSGGVLSCGGVLWLSACYSSPTRVVTRVTSSLVIIIVGRVSLPPD